MISIQNISYQYHKKRALIDHLDLELKPGKIYGLLGKNGTGKTTLLKLIQGVLFNKSGEIRVGITQSCKRDVDFLSSIYFLQEEYELPSIKVSNYFKAYAPFYPNFDESKFRTIIDIFELEDSRSFNNYSYGQKKKFLIAFALASNTPYLMMDEPTNGLDIPSKSQFRKIVAGNINEDQTVIISTHQVRDLSNLIDSVIVIEEGNIIFHEDLYNITEKLSFSRGFSEEKGSDVIYSEMIPGGYMTIKTGTDGESSAVDVEALFNAIISEPTQINQLFK